MEISAEGRLVDAIDVFEIPDRTCSEKAGQQAADPLEAAGLGQEVAALARLMRTPPA